MSARTARLLLDGEAREGEYHDGYITVGGRRLEVDGRTLLPPSSPTKIICVGLNYRDHALEMGNPLPEEPLLFLKPPTSLAGHNQVVVRPAEVSRLDYEGELALVVGRRCRNVSEADALACLAGLTVANDVTARNFQLPGTQWTRAKGYDSFAPVGPCVLESREWQGLGVTTRLNGVRVQSSSTDQLIFGVPALVVFISRVMTLEPGDLILTGTPSGVGPMREGDLVEVTIDGIGTLANRIEAESSPASVGATST